MNTVLRPNLYAFRIILIYAQEGGITPYTLW